MPGIDELQWKEYADFTGGLWERNNDLECPENGLLESTDCFPDPGGGLKAFANFQPINIPFQAGDSRPTSRANVVGLWRGRARGATRGLYTITVDGAAPPYSVRVLASSDSDLSITEGGLSGNGTMLWTNVLYRTDINNLSPSIRMEEFYAPGPSNAIFFNFPVDLTTGSTNGIWYTNSTGSATFGMSIPGGSAVTTANSFFPIGLWNYQNRLLTLSGDVLNRESIWYSNPGVVSISTANYLKPRAAGAIEWIEPFSPSEIVMMVTDDAIVSAQGAITAPTVRDLQRTHTTTRNYPIRTPIGLVMVVTNEGAYSWDGQSMNHISQAILGDPMGGTSQAITGAMDSNTETQVGLVDLDNASWVTRGTSGHLGCYDHWVLFNNGYVLDSRTGAWFKQTSAPGARYWSTDYAARRVYVSCKNSFTLDATSFVPSPPVMYWSRMPEASWTASETYSFTLPLIYKSFQKTNVRQLEYHVNAFNDASTLTVQCTNADGVVIDNGPYELRSGAQPVRVNIPGHPADWWKVRTTMRSNRSQVAAPSLSRMSCGSQDATRYRTA